MDLENIMLIEISQKKTNTIGFHFYVESKKAKLIKIVKWWLPAFRHGGIGERLFKDTVLQLVVNKS